MNIMKKIAEKYKVSLHQKDFAIKRQILLKIRKLMKINENMGFKDNNIILDCLKIFENCKLEAYYEQTGHNVSMCQEEGNIAVGYGFNLTRPEAEAEFLSILPNVCFEAVKKGKRKLKQEEADLLLLESVKIRTKELNVIFQRQWNYLPEYVKVALESVYYNCPRIFYAKTNLKNKIKDFLIKKDEMILYEIAEMLIMYKHKNFPEALNERRRLECVLMCGTEDFYEIQQSSYELELACVGYL